MVLARVLRIILGVLLFVRVRVGIVTIIVHVATMLLFGVVLEAVFARVDATFLVKSLSSLALGAFLVS